MAVIKPQNSCCEVVDDVMMTVGNRAQFALTFKNLVGSQCLKKIRARAMEENVQRRDCGVRTQLNVHSNGKKYVFLQGNISDVTEMFRCGGGAGQTKICFTFPPQI